MLPRNKKMQMLKRSYKGSINMNGKEIKEFYKNWKLGELKINLGTKVGTRFPKSTREKNIRKKR